MKKKLLCGVLAALMLLSSFACTKGGDETPTDTTDIATTEAPVIELPTDTTVEETTEEVTELPMPTEVSLPEG